MHNKEHRLPSAKNGAGGGGGRGTYDMATFIIAVAIGPVTGPLVPWLLVR